MRQTLPALVLVLLSLAPVRAEKIALVAGGGEGPDGSPATAAKLTQPFGVDFDGDGNLIFVEMTGQRVRKIDAKGVVSTVGGDGQKGAEGDGGDAAKARFNGIHNLAIAPNGDIYLADTWNSRVRKIDAKGTVTTVAGTGKRGFSGDGGPATQADFGNVYCVTLDPKGEKLYAADLDNRRIRVIDLKSGVVSTVAGNGKKGVPEDGATAKEAPLVDPRAVAPDADGNVYILERSGHALRAVDAAGKIRTVAGTGKAGLSGDGGDARKAALNGPKHLCIDRDGTVLLADTENHVVRRYNPKDGTIVRVAGSGKKGTKGVGGSPLDSEMNQPHGVYVHRDGSLYISDSSNHRILKLTR
jgi:DNA-binding beta-propeller fold protein YncE